MTKLIRLLPGYHHHPHRRHSVKPANVGCQARSGHLTQMDTSLCKQRARDLTGATRRPECDPAHTSPQIRSAGAWRAARTPAMPAAEGSPMAEKKTLVVYAAAYETVHAALADLDAIEQLHKDELIGQYDAAVIDQENGRPHVVKRMDRPHIRVIPEWFGGGTLPRKELHEAAEQLTANQAGLIAVGEPTIEKGLDKAFAGATRVVKRAVEATTDEITSELQEALKEADMVDMHFEVDIIPVSDVDRSKQFYQRLGWRLDSDVAPLEGLRIVQFTPPGSGASVTFGT